MASAVWLRDDVDAAGLRRLAVRASHMDKVIERAKIVAGDLVRGLGWCFLKSCVVRRGI